VLYAETKPDPSLVRVVDLGPFTQNVDDGLPLRKAAYQALGTILSVAPHRVDVREFVGYISTGLTDYDDVQMLAYAILYDMAQHHQTALLEVLDSLPDVILNGVKQKLKEAKGAEPQRALDVLRATVRSLYAIHCVPGVEVCGRFCDFYLRVLKTALLAKMLQELVASKGHRA